jgi:hypothetical protein
LILIVGRLMGFPVSLVPDNGLEFATTALGKVCAAHRCARRCRYGTV